MSLRVLDAGPGVTIQDAGRRGYLRYGVPESGPMDWLAYEIVNRALGNPRDAACVEISLGGIEVACEQRPMRVAFGGGAFAWARDGAALPAAAVVNLAPGERLAARAARRGGAWTYLAIEGGVDVPPVLASRSTYARFAIGGLDGRALRGGDRLSALATSPPGREEGALVSPLLERSDAPLRVVLGPQDDYFTTAALDAFFSERFSVSPRFDRMGYWLDGPRLSHAAGFDIVSDGIALGAIQVPGDGRALVLMADHQSTGGYPKLGTVARADVPALAQRRPGEPFSFVRCDVDEARGALLALDAALNEPLALRPLAPHPRRQALHAANLIGGVVDATDAGTS